MVKEGRKSAQEQEIYTDSAKSKQNSRTFFFFLTQCILYK